MAQKKCKKLFPFPDFVVVDCVYKGLGDTVVIHLVEPRLAEMVEAQGAVPEGFNDERPIGLPALAVDSQFIPSSCPTAFVVQPCFHLCLNVGLLEGLNQDAATASGKLVDKLIGWNLTELVLLVRVRDVSMSFHGVPHWVDSMSLIYLIKTLASIECGNFLCKK